MADWSLRESMPVLPVLGNPKTPKPLCYKDYTKSKLTNRRRG
jgi:hypothetical protein